jgi:hypothetical protein
VLDNLRLTWVTNTAASSARLYRENKLPFFVPMGVTIPVVMSAFPDEIYQVPRSWAEQAYPNLVHYNTLDVGGHFAAWEQPKLLSEEARAGLRSLRQAESGGRRPARHRPPRETQVVRDVKPSQRHLLPGVVTRPGLTGTPDGWEPHVAADHLGHVELALGVRDALAAAGQSWIVAMSAGRHMLRAGAFEDSGRAVRIYDVVLI